LAGNIILFEKERITHIMMVLQLLVYLSFVCSLLTFCSEKELESLDIHHALMLATLKVKLHCAPIDPDPQGVLDIWTGTVIWAIDFGIAHESHIWSGCAVLTIPFNRGPVSFGDGRVILFFRYHGRSLVNSPLTTIRAPHNKPSMASQKRNVIPSELLIV
jgi:hypothetical protein